MTGYCETCGVVVRSVVDEIGGGDVCPNCMDDVHPGFHLEEDFDDEGDLVVIDDDFDRWLLNG